MKKNLELKAFNDVPWFIKDAIGWPDNYMNLTTDQQTFVYNLCVAKDSTREDLEGLKEDLETIIADL
jgi:hypothetical protein